ncbi:hypothetical protein Franean1_2965 [Parafrankia sp. EAN1pec]|uniref:hypothetical protein n=1 Tax=Parafrankia sp. (strain EAN1pec) TaxID=298653 RepID=UPI0000543287|nr:hypothetical protein Franean1_2965 [Frankia sp. EAN1pec]
MTGKRRVTPRAAMALDDAVERLEAMLFDKDVPEQAVRRRSFELRKSLTLPRREVLLMREAVAGLMRPEVEADIVTLDGAGKPTFGRFAKR